MNAPAQRHPLLPRGADGRRQGIVLSVLVHIGLLIAIAIGLHWRSHTPEASEAELWSAVPQAAAPREAEPVVAPPPPAPPAPAPKPAPKVVEPPAPVPDAQIAIEKARKEREAREAAAEREVQQKKLAAEKARKAEEAEKAEKAAEAAAKAERDRIAKQEAADKKRQQEAAEKKKQQALEAQQAKEREAARAEQIKRIQGMAGASGDAGATGSAQRSAGPSAGYAGRIKAKVRPNIVFADQVAGNPTAEVEVRAAPDGTIIGRRLVKSSGIQSWDDAVLRAIDKTAVLPRDTDGRVPPTLLLVFQPGE